MKYCLLLPLLFTFYASICQSPKKRRASDTVNAYFPAPLFWNHVAAYQSFDTLLLRKAINFAIAHESGNPRSMEENHLRTFGMEPFGKAIGPFKDRGDQTGILIHHGYIVAEWGEPARIDMTHSVTKSFLSMIAGVAVDRQLIASVTDTVYKSMPPIQLYDPPHTTSVQEDFREIHFVDLFQSPHNKLLTWEVMLRQTSDWEGMLWGKPDWADRPDSNRNNWLNRVRNAPGAVFEYNDVRVNAFSLALLNVWRRPLPQVLKETIMDPIGASASWRWAGYSNSWIVLDGQPVQSVSGGGHWGGGMFINAYDMARFGMLTLHKGNWKGQQLVSKKWIEQSLSPTGAQPGYGYMNFFLNKDKKYMPHAPATAFNHIGNGTNVIYVDPENDIVMVLRWVESSAIDGVVQRMLEALKN